MLRKGLQKDQNSFLLRIRVLPAEWGGDCQLGGSWGTRSRHPHTPSKAGCWVEVRWIRSGGSRALLCLREGTFLGWTSPARVIDSSPAVPRCHTLEAKPSPN